MKEYTTLVDLFNRIENIKQLYISSPKKIRVCADIWLELMLLHISESKPYNNTSIFGITIELDLNLINKFEIDY